MNEQVGNAIRAHVFFVASKQGKLALTVTVDVHRNGIEIVTAAAATEIGDGLYTYALASDNVTVEGYYTFVFKTADATVDQQHLPALIWIQKAGVEFLGSGMVTAVQPVSGNGQVLLLVRGDDYVEADGRAISLSSSSWPNLTGVTSVTLTVRSKMTDAILFTKTDKATSRVVGAGTQTVVFEPAAADTGTLVPPGLTAKYDIEAVLSSRKITLASGNVDVREDQTRV